MTLASLPQPIASSASAQHHEYPSARPLSSTRWVIATGTGSLYVLETSDGGDFIGRLIARYDLETPDTDSSPFVIQAAHMGTNGTRMLLSRSIPPRDAGRKTASTTSFELLEARLDADRENGLDDKPKPLEVSWRLQGGDLPVWCGWKGDGWVVLSSEAYVQEEAEQEETEADRVKREEKARIEKLGLGATLPTSNVSKVKERETQGMDVDPIEPEVTSIAPEEEREWPFSWTQTADSLSVAIPLPPNTTRKDIQVDLSALEFSLTVATPPSPVLAAFLSRPTRSFWTTIDPSTSTWSFNSIKHVLELELTKVDINTRWPSVFASAEDDDEEDEEEDVPETLSAAMLASVRASFSNIKTRNEDEPTGNHPAIPALIREEMDYDLEDGEDFGENTTGVFGEAGGGTKVGRDVYVGYIKDGVPSFSKAQSSIVSMPIANKGGMMIKSAVDGILFNVPEGNPAKSPWKHISTSPALSFVLSSKRDLRLVRHVKGGEGTTVFAFDAGGSGTASGNVYVYYPPHSSSVAKQGVVRVSGSDRGALLGVGEVVVDEKKVVVALCEKTLVVLHGVL